MDTIISYIDQYGYIVLFIYLMLDLIALPLPGQSLMTYTGFLVYKGHLALAPSILIATLGSSVGITITYIIGYKVGFPFLIKYGRIFKLSPDVLKKTSAWYHKHGNILLTIGYFIPGVRHFTGYFAGIAKMRPRAFIIFAYSGALIWSTTFISFGRFLGPQWDKLPPPIKNIILISFGIFIVGALLIYLLNFLRKRR